MRTPYLMSLVDVAAERYELPRRMVQALIGKESAWNPWAWNPEPRYRYYWDVRNGSPFRAVTEAELMSERPPADFGSLAADPDQEWWGQAASWGLMQIMGAVARERGSRLPYLTELLDPAINVDYGCRHLADSLAWARRYAHTPEEAVAASLAAYNGGRGGNKPGGPLRNDAYARDVLRRMDSLTL